MLSKFSVKKPYTVVVAIIIVAVLGVVSFMNMTTDLMPSMNMPYAVVSTAYIGASPEEVEEVVTKNIEQAMTSISNIKNITSTSAENFSAVVLEFNQSTNMDTAMLEMREKLDLLSSNFPDEVQSSSIMKINPSMMPVMAVAVSVDASNKDYNIEFIRNKIISEVESINGIATVSAGGLTENFVNIVIDNKKLEDVNHDINNKMMDAMVDAYIAEMQANGIPLPPVEDAAQMYALLPPEMAEQIPEIAVTNEMLEGLLKGQNFSMPTGNITDDATSYLVKTGDKIKSVDELKDMLIASIPLPTGAAPIEIRISDIAEVQSLDTSADTYAKVNGERGLLLTLTKQADFSTAEITKSATARFSELEETYEGVHFSTLMDQGDYVNIMINAIFKNIIIGAILAAIILLLFLKSFRSTFVIALSIIVSVVTAYVLMYFSGITLNVISMGGLALGIGMLVDNSIVVIENIYRMRNEGMSATAAAIEGAKQVSGAILASTITTIIVFVPILFTEGFTRQIFTDMGLTITFSLIASLVVALTLVPTAAATVLSKKPIKVNKTFDKIKDAYSKLLARTLNHKWVIYLLAVVLLGGSILGATNLGAELIPESDMGNFMVTMEVKDGTKKQDIYANIDEVVSVITKIEGVKTVGAMYGGDAGMAGMFGGGDSPILYVLLDEGRSHKITTGTVGKEIRELAQDKDYGLTVSAASADISALTGGAVVVDIYSRELDTLSEYANKVADEIAKVEGVIEVDNGLGEQSDELRITVDKDKAMANGLAVAQVFSEVNKLINHGDVATSITDNGIDYDIYVDKEGSEVGISDIENLEITTAMGAVKVKDIADVSKTKGMQSISRADGARYVSVTASIDEGYIVGDVNAEITKTIKDIPVQSGVEIKQVGQNEMMNQTFKDLALMLVLAILFIYLVMVAQFQSLLSPFIVMFTIPLAFTGGFFAQLITGTPISAVSLIGMVLLVGIVVNNGIVFVDYTNKLIKEQGMETRDALVKAGKDRIRPILLTALTTIFAQLALCIDTSSAAAMTQAMAITAIGGLAYATVLTLFLVPALYESFHKNDKKRAEKKRLKQANA